MPEMTEREQFELTAKAAGLQEYGFMGPCFMHVVDNRLVEWNPRDDDGDALRLAVRLNIHLINSRTDAWASTPTFTKFEPFGSDPYAATRLAIFKAAVEIGRNM